MIELQILIAAVLVALAVFIPRLASGEGFFKALLVAVAWVAGIFGSLVALAFLGMLPQMVRDWYATPAAVRAARKRNALKALEAILADRLDTRATDRFGNTPLHEALWMPSLKPQHVAEMVAVLVAAGADRDVANRSGGTPRTLAEKSGETAVIAAMNGAGGS